MMNPAIGAEYEQEKSPQALLPTTEKRKHAEVGGDSSPPQSKPMIPLEKRSCVENVDQQPPESLPIEVENTYDDSSDDQLGDLGGNYFVPEKEDEYRDFTGVCTNPFKPLNFKENPGLYADLKLFAEKSIHRCNAIMKTNLRFEELEEVTSCHSDCSHHLVTINVTDPLDKMSVVVLRGRLRSGATFAVADPQDFLILGAY